MEKKEEAKRILTGDRPTRKITYWTLFWVIAK